MEMPSGEVRMGVATATLSLVVDEESKSTVLHERAMALGRLGAGSESRETSGAARQETSVFVGEGLPPVPGRLAERIRKWES